MTRHKLGSAVRKPAAIGEAALAGLLENLRTLIRDGRQQVLRSVDAVQV
jgi:hypothetical protein